MSFPKQSEIELPLLKVLHQLGGKAEPKELYPKLTEMFPQLTEEDLAARMPSSPSIFRWHNIVQWSGQKLVEKGEIDPTTRGVWKLTARGRARAIGSAANTSEELLLANQATLKDLVYENEAEVKRRIISELPQPRINRVRAVLRFVAGTARIPATPSHKSRCRSRHRRIWTVSSGRRHNPLSLPSQALAQQSGQPAGDRQVPGRNTG